MNRKYMKLGVLLIAIFAFFGNANSVFAMRWDNCKPSSPYAKTKDGQTECILYGNKGTMRITARNCDDGQTGSFAGMTIYYNNTKTHLRYIDLGFNAKGDDYGYGDYADRVWNKGCPTFTELNPDNYTPIFDAHDAAFLFPGDKTAKGGKNKNKYHDAYSIRDGYYNDIKASADNANKTIEDNIGKMREALKDNYNVSDNNDNFFSELPTTDKFSIPKYTQGSNKYTEAYLLGAKSNKLVSILDELKKDANTIAKLSNSVNLASSYTKDLLAGYTSLYDSGCKEKKVLEGGYTEAFLGFDNLDTAKKEVTDYLNKNVKGAPDNKKNIILDTVTTCNKYAIFNAGNETQISKYFNELNKINAENKGLQDTLKWLKAAAEKRGLVLNGLDDTLKVVENNDTSLATAAENFAFCLDGLESEYFDYGLNEEVDCTSMIGEDAMVYLNNMYFFAEVVVVALVVILSMVEFVKSATSSDAESMKKAIKKTVTRLMLVVCIVLLPLFINFVIEVFEIKGIDPNHPICITDSTTQSDSNVEGE